MKGNAAAQRLARIRLRLSELGLDALLVSHLPNVRYLTGFSGSCGWLLVGADRAIFATDGRYEQQAGEEIGTDADVELMVVRDGVFGELAGRAAQEFAGARVGFESGHLTYADWERLREHGDGVMWEAVTGTVEGLRAVKDPDEIAALEKAARIAAEALQQTLAMVEPGVREVDIAAELEYRMRRLGADGPAFETMVASGARSALPHAATSLKEVREGDLLLIDFGARWGGYHSDLTRTFVVGDPTSRQEEVYRLVLEAQAAASAALQAGRSGDEVDEAARSVFERCGTADRFTHSTGHGLGLEVHEGPRLGRKSEARLEANMVVTVEPGLYFPDWGGVRIEDDLVVTAARPRPLVELRKGELEAVPDGRAAGG
jgi:Xaa-Pro aminopeptidase